VAELGAVPPLRDPVLVAAFEGWNDAGEAATAAIGHLVRRWRAEPVAEIDPEDYYDFQVNRPRVSMTLGNRRISWPTTRVLVARTRPGAHDVVIVEGIEPSMRWRAFTAELLDVAQRLGVRRVITMGALLADVPHSRPIPVSTTSDDPAAQSLFGAEPSDYEGPTGIVGVFSSAAAEAGMQAISCWAAVPHYAGGPPSPKATLALLTRVEVLLGVPVSAEDFESDARRWERTVDELAQADEEVADYVRSLEEDADGAETAEVAELPEGSGDEIAREFERYLRRHDEGPGSR
jgi:proteasome assembly chaperone (PAC2) family protein